MSKRARRERTPNLPPEAFNVPAAPATPKANAATTAQAATSAAAKAPNATGVDWKHEYGEVIGDLRRTFLIFAALVVAMIALSFVIR